jgi:ABC-2 type transport system permease protein
MMESLWRFCSTAWIAYRTLFHWLNPASYVASKVVGPFFQILVLALLADRAGGVRAMDFAVLGNVTSLVTLNGIYGVTRSIQNERVLGTLPYVIATPGSHVTAFLAQGVMHWADGVLNAAVAGVIATLVVGPILPPGHDEIAALALIMAGWSATCLGFCLGSLTLIVREWAFFLTNVAYAALLAFAGVNFPTNRLPSVIRPISLVLPLTHSLLVMRGNARGMAAVVDLGTEMLLGVAYVCVGTVLMSTLERRARRLGLLDRL